MSERDGYIAGVPCWIDTSQPDPEAALLFYRGLFGWDFEDRMPEGSEGKYFVGRIRGGDVAAISPAPAGEPQIARWNTYIWVDSADETVAKARAAGGSVATEPFDVFDAGRMAVLADPEGAVFCVWQAKNNKGAKVVNEHGSLNFNGLATRDVDGAEAFYGAVFGWQTMSLTSGLMWRLPGYGDHLEEITPGVRKQHADIGAPEGFIDVIAALDPISEDDSETPAHWSVTFAVDDAECHRGQGDRSRGRGHCRTSRCPVEQGGGDQGSARRHIHREPVRSGEPEPRGLARRPRAGRRRPRPSRRRGASTWRSRDVNCSATTQPASSSHPSHPSAGGRQARSNRSRFITLSQAATKSRTNFVLPVVASRRPRPALGAASSNRTRDRRRWPSTWPRRSPGRDPRTRPRPRRTPSTPSPCRAG